MHDAKRLIAATLFAMLASASGAVAGPYTITTFEVPGSVPEETWVSGINDAGQIVGYAGTAGGAGVEAYVKSGGSFTLLNAPGNALTYGFGLNNLGQVVGVSYAPPTYAGAPLLYSGGAFTSVSGVPRQATLSGINDAGQIVGYTNTGFLYSNGTLTPLVVAGAQVTFGTAINNAGVVVGYAVLDDATGSNTGFMYANGVYTTFNLPGTCGFGATGINNAGAIVGNYTTCGTNNHHAFIYQNGAFTTFDLPFGYGTAVTGINDLGQIVGDYCSVSIDCNGTRGFEASPGAATVPEPASIALLGSGLLMIGAARRRRTPARP